MDLLAEQGPLLGEPYTRQLDGKLRELRLRVSYWIAPGRRIVLLTVIVKRRPHETREVARAKRAMGRCIAEEHPSDEEQDDG